MVKLDLVHKSNSQLHDLGPGLVAVFGKYLPNLVFASWHFEDKLIDNINLRIVGGTSGIGEAILKAYIKHTISSKAYIIGRNEASASRIIKECSTLNPGAEVHFIQGNVAELKEVDRVCKEIFSRERHLNLLVQTQGTFNMKGRDGKFPILDISSPGHIFYFRPSNT